MLNYCIYCGLTFHPGKWWWQEIETKSRQCTCGKVTSMLNIKITAEVNGKIVPLSTISTESFEAIKALEKSKEIPVARLATMNGRRKLIIKMTKLITDYKGQYVAVDLGDGRVTGHWSGSDDSDCGSGYGYSYDNIKSL